MRRPPIALVRQFDTHRLVPTRRGDSVLTRIADPDADLQVLFELDAATNDRLAAERRRHDGIGVEELVFNIPFFEVVNAAFCHPHPLGARFNGPRRGAWYAGFELATAQAEVAFHKRVELDEIGWTAEEAPLYDDYLADISAELHDLRGRGFKALLDPDSYVASQALAEQLLEAGALGLVYPSVRETDGTCVACFRPAIVGHVRRGPTYQLSTTAGTFSRR